MNVFDIIYDENTGQSLYVSRATGEVFAPQNDQGYCIVSVDQIRSRQDAAIRWRKVQADRAPPPYGRFVWVRVPAAAPLFPGLNGTHASYLLYMAAQIDYAGSLPAGITMTPRGIASLLGASQRDSSRFLKEIRELGYIEDRPPAARLSPDAFYRGELRHPSPGCFYTRLYAAGADGLYGTDAFRYLPAIIPYLHRTLNVLCENPCEMDQEKIQVLTWAAVCARAGYSPRQAARIGKLAFGTCFSIDGQRQRMLVRIKGPPTPLVDGIYLNPRLVYAGSNGVARVLAPYFRVQSIDP